MGVFVVFGQDLAAPRQSVYSEVPPGGDPSRPALRSVHLFRYLYRFRADVCLSAFHVHLIAAKGGTQT